MDRYKKRALNFSSSQDQRILRAQRRSIDRKSIRDNDLFVRRRMEPLSESTEDKSLGAPTPLKPTSIPAPKESIKPSRLQLLQKWKAEKEMKKKLEEAKKKPVFKVSHVSHLPSKNGSSGDFQIKGSANTRQTSRRNIPAPTPVSRVPRATTVKSKVTVPSLANDPSTVPKYNQPRFTRNLLSKTNTPIVPASTRNAAASCYKSQPKLDKVTPKSQFQKSLETVQKAGQTSFVSTNLKQKTTSLTKLTGSSGNRKQNSFAPPNFKFTAPPQMKVYLLDKPLSSRVEQQSRFGRNFGTKTNISVKSTSIQRVAEESTEKEELQINHNGISQSDGQFLNEDSNDNCDKNEPPSYRSIQLSLVQKPCKPPVLCETTKAKDGQNLDLEVPLQTPEDILVSDVCKSLEDKENIEQPSHSSLLHPVSFNLSESLEKVSLSTLSCQDVKEVESRNENACFKTHLQDTLQKPNIHANVQSHVGEENSASPCRRSRRILASQNKKISSFDYKCQKLPSINEPEEYGEDSEHGSKKTEEQDKLQTNTCNFSNQFEINKSPPIRRSARLSAIQNLRLPGDNDLNNEQIPVIGSPLLPCNGSKSNRISLLGTPISVLNRRGRVSVIKDDLITFSPGF